MGPILSFKGIAIMPPNHPGEDEAATAGDRAIPHPHWIMAQSSLCLKEVMDPLCRRNMAFQRLFRWLEQLRWVKCLRVQWCPRSHPARWLPMQWHQMPWLRPTRCWSVVLHQCSFTTVIRTGNGWINILSKNIINDWVDGECLSVMVIHLTALIGTMLPHGKWRNVRYQIYRLCNSPSTPLLTDTTLRFPIVSLQHKFRFHLDLHRLTTLYSLHFASFRAYCITTSFSVWHRICRCVSIRCQTLCLADMYYLLWWPPPCGSVSFVHFCVFFYRFCFHLSLFSIACFDRVRVTYWQNSIIARPPDAPRTFLIVPSMPPMDTASLL